MGNPHIFISCVSSEFRTLRGQVADIVQRLGYTPITQEILGTEAGDLRQVLRGKIDGCVGLIQLIGVGYGAEPAKVEDAFGRVSYTQFELLYARQKGIKTWYIFAGDGCYRDTPLQQLDQPRGDHPDPTGYQAERRQLQQKYIDRCRGFGELYQRAGSDAELLLKIEQTKDELAELQRAEAKWKRSMVAGLAVVIILLAAVLGGLAWKHFQDEQTRKQLEKVAADRELTREKIRAHLQESADRAHQSALAAADKSAKWQDRQKLRDIADAEHKARLSKIDALAAEFAKVEGTAGSTKVLDELTRILAGEGVDAALAYVDTQRAGILQTVRSRAASAREQNRAELQPLLNSARLYVSQSNYAKADALLDEILAVEPEWIQPLDVRFWMLIARAERASTHGTLAEVRNYCEAADKLGKRLVSLTPHMPYVEGHMSVVTTMLGDALQDLGDYPAALKAYSEGLVIDEKLCTADPKDTNRRRGMFVAHTKIGNVQLIQWDLPAARQSFERAMSIIQPLAASDPTNDMWQRDLSVGHTSIADEQLDRGDVSGAMKSYRTSLALREQLAERQRKDPSVQRDLVLCHGRISSAQLRSNDIPGALESARKALAIAATLSASDPSNLQSQFDLSIAHEQIGETVIRQSDVAGAVKAYRASYAIREKLIAADPRNVDWKRSQIQTCKDLGRLLDAQQDPAAMDFWRRCLELVASLKADGVALTGPEAELLRAVETKLGRP